MCIDNRMAIVTQCTNIGMKMNKLCLKDNMNLTKIV